jgi:hypothetical protein
MLEPSKSTSWTNGLKAIGNATSATLQEENLRKKHLRPEIFPAEGGKLTESGSPNLHARSDLDACVIQSSSTVGAIGLMGRTLADAWRAA